MTGVEINHNDALVGGEKLMSNGEEVGVINSPGYSHRLQKSLALVHLHPNATAIGTQLEVVGEDGNYTAQVSSIPFYDPTKSRVKA